jgi:hypothetical protein
MHLKNEDFRSAEEDPETENKYMVVPVHRAGRFLFFLTQNI